MENQKLTQNSEENKQEFVTQTDNSKNFVIPQAENNNKKRFNNKKRNFNKKSKFELEFEQKLVEVKRVTVVTKGGRRFSFSALVVIGNKKGVVGWGSGKANEVPDAIKKAIKHASKNLVNVPIIDKRTIPHVQNSKFLASKVLIKPAPKGKGLIASGPVRSVVELAGYKDIYTKSLGSRSKANVVKATIKALQELRTIEEAAKMRGVEVEQLQG